MSDAPAPFYRSITRVRLAEAAKRILVAIAIVGFAASTLSFLNRPTAALAVISTVPHGRKDAAGPSQAHRSQALEEAAGIVVRVVVSPSGESSAGSSPSPGAQDGPMLTMTKDGAFTVEDYSAEVLRRLAIGAGVPVADVLTEQHLEALIAFSIGEGGGVDGHLGAFNLWNTKRLDADLHGVPAGDVSGESFATVDYPTFDDGVEASARTFEQPNYNRLLDVLLDPSTSSVQFFAALATPQDTAGNSNWSANDLANANKYWQCLEAVDNDYYLYAPPALDAAGQPSPPPATAIGFAAQAAVKVENPFSGH